MSHSGPLALFEPPKPPEVPGIHLECCDVRDLIRPDENGKRRMEGVRLLFVDNPWDLYHQKLGQSDPKSKYPTLTLDECRDINHAAAACCLPGARMVWWYTNPLADEIDVKRFIGKPWTFKTAGAWNKSGVQGPGYHWGGNSEPVRIYTLKGTPCTDPKVVLRSGYTSRPGAHSAKPFEWQKKMIEKWTKPGDLVGDLFGGECGVARACYDLGRRCITAEIDPTRHVRAVGLLAHHVGKAS